MAASGVARGAGDPATGDARQHPRAGLDRGALQEFFDQGDPRFAAELARHAVCSPDTLDWQDGHGSNHDADPPTVLRCSGIAPTRQFSWPAWCARTSRRKRSIRSPRACADEVHCLTGQNRALIVGRRDDYESLFQRTLEHGGRTGQFQITDLRVARYALAETCNGVADWYRPGGRLPVARSSRHRRPGARDRAHRRRAGVLGRGGPARGGGATPTWRMRPGVGAVATEAIVEPAYGPRCLDAIQADATPLVCWPGRTQLTRPGTGRGCECSDREHARLHRHTERSASGIARPDREGHRVTCANGRPKPVTWRALRAAAEQRAAEEGQFRAEADAATEEMAAQLAAAQAHANDAETARTKAESRRDAAIEEARRDAAARAAPPRPTGTPRSSRHVLRLTAGSAPRGRPRPGPAGRGRRRGDGPCSRRSPQRWSRSPCPTPRPDRHSRTPSAHSRAEP